MGTLVDNNHKSLKKLKEEIVDNDEILNFVNEIEEDDRTIEDFKKDYPNEIKNSGEALLNHMGDNDLKLLKTGFPDKWEYLNKKLAYQYEFFNFIEDNQRSVHNLKKADVFSKLKTDYPSDEEMERTKEIFERFTFKIGEEITEL